MLLSDHFAREEFEKDGQMPDGVVDAYRNLCTCLLEPIRAHVGQPLRILSGYRSFSANVAVGGVNDSQHVATPAHCAADWWIPTAVIRDVFDWIRTASGLPFDQVILEHGHTNDIIHISWSTTPRRQALEGATQNRTGYKTWEVS